MAFVAVLRLVKDHPEPTQEKVDYGGIITLSVGVIAILVALDQASVVGYTDPVVLGLFTLGVVMLVAFRSVEGAVGAAALVPSDLVRNRQFAAPCASVLLMAATLVAVVVYVPQYTQKVLGWSAVEAGLGLVPVMLTFGVVSFAAGPLYNQLGARLTVGIGAVALASGILWVAVSIFASSGYPLLAVGLVTFGIGMGLFFSGVTTAAVSSVATRQASLAGGIVYMCNIAGGAVGLGFSTAIVLAVGSFADGIALAFLVDGILAVLGATLALVFITGGGTWHLGLHRLNRAHG